MKKALIFQGKLIEVNLLAFPVSPEMHWVDVADDVTPETHQLQNGVIVEIPKPPPKSYQELRAAAYPPAADYLDGIVKADNLQIKAYTDACLAVKATFPK